VLVKRESAWHKRSAQGYAQIYEIDGIEGATRSRTQKGFKLFCT